MYATWVTNECMGVIRTIFRLLLAPFRFLFGGFSYQGGTRGRVRFFALVLVATALILASFDYPRYWDNAVNWWNNRVAAVKLPGFYKLPFRLGLDLQGGAHLLYQADVSDIPDAERAEAMESVRDTIERRVNLFGVAEPIVQVNRAGEHYRLIVELAGVYDISEAIKLIGETPILEFKEKLPPEKGLAIAKQKLGEEGEKLTVANVEQLCSSGTFVAFIRQYNEDPCYETTKLGGAHLERAGVTFDEQTNEPQVSLQFNAEGTQLFADITKRNIEQPVAIYLDGLPISIPVVRSEITEGQAVISGGFSVDEARQLSQRLNAGALKVPITLVSQQTVGATLGATSLAQSLRAAFIGFAAIALFMIALYRLPGLLSVVALGFYVALVLAIFKLIPVTLTLSGIAGFVLSLGIAVDANVLVFERMREERRNGRALHAAIEEGFRRAWPSIRDGNVSTLITTTILYAFGTSLIQGFALTLAIGILASVFSALVVTRVLLRSLMGPRLERVAAFLF